MGGAIVGMETRRRKPVLPEIPARRASRCPGSSHPSTQLFEEDAEFLLSVEACRRLGRNDRGRHMSDMRVCAVIPTFNHFDALDRILSRLGERELTTIVVDDGSTPETAARIRAICERHSHVEYLGLPVNGGKGAAVLSGIAR